MSVKVVAMKSFFKFLALMFIVGLLTANIPIKESQKLISSDASDIILFNKKDKIHSSTDFQQIAYITTQDSGNLVAIDLPSGSVKGKYSLDFPSKILNFSVDGTAVYLVNLATAQLVKMDLTNRSIRNLASPEGIPNRLAVSPKGLKGYATYEGSHEIVCLDFQNECFSTLATFQMMPNSLVFDPSHERLLVSFKESGDIFAVDTSSCVATSFLSLDAPAEDLEISSDRKQMYAIQKGASHLCLIDLDTKAHTTIEYDSSQDLLSNFEGNGIVARGMEGRLYLAKDRGNQIINFDLQTHKADPIVIFDEPMSSIEFLPSPLLAASFTLSEPVAGAPAIFDASLTKSQNDGFIEYEWNFGDGVEVITEEPIVEHVYESSGHYVARLTVKQQIDQDPEAHEKFVGKLVAKSKAAFVVSPKIDQTFNDSLKKKLFKFLGFGKDSTNKSPELNAKLAGTPTSTSLVSSVNPSLFGQTVTFTATVTPIPTLGTTVTFFDGATIIGTVSVNVSGIAALNISTLNVSGSPHSITATYNGDGIYDPSTSNTVIQVVNKGSTTTTLNSVAPNPSTYGTNVVFNASVAAISPAVGPPTGTVNFYYNSGGTLIGSGTLNGSGVATLTINTLVPNSYPSITAVYQGSTNFNGSTSLTGPTLVVNPATPTNVLTSSLNPSNYGDVVTFTATVTSPTSLAFPSGTLTFFDGATPIGTGTFTGTGNTRTATLSINSLSSATHPITAVLAADSLFNGVTSNTVSQVVNPVSSSTSLISLSNSPTLYGQTINLEAVITGLIPNAPLPPSGQVEFYDDTTSTLLGTATITQTLNSNTSAAFFSYTGPPYLALGSHQLKAVYLGDINYIGSSSPELTQEIVSTPTKTVTTPNPLSVYGEPVVFVATVSAIAPGGGTPTGNVEFYNDPDGVVSLGTATLVNGVATFTVPIVLPVGSHLINTVYLGDGNYDSSVARSIIHIVVQDNTTTTLTSDVNPSTFGQTVTFTATVTANSPGSGIPSGTVTFYNGATNVGTSPLNGSGVATLQVCNLYPDTNGALKTYSFTAVYSGDVNFVTSTSNVLSQQVQNKLNTNTTVTSDENPVAVCPDIVNFTATIVPATPCNLGLPQTGTVQFYNGATLLGTANVSNGTATLSGICFPSVGTYPITAVYSGDNPTNYFNGSTSPIYNQVVVLYDTTTTLTSSSSLSQQGTTTLTATVAALGGPYTPGFGSTGGTITFYSGNTPIPGGSNLPVPDSGIVTFMATLCFDCNSIYAVYSGDPTYYDMSMSNTVLQQVQQTDMLSTKTTVTQDSATTYFCEPVTFTATVEEIISNCNPTPTGTCTPTGTVTFFDQGIAIGGATLDKNGTATITVSNLAIGTHNITASYNSDSNFAFSISPQIVHAVLANPTTVVLSLIPNLPLIPYEEQIILSARVTSASGATPTGSVIFSDQNGNQITVAVSSLGNAVQVFDLLEAGSYTYTATYDPDCCAITQSCFEPSTSNTLNFIVTKVLPTLTLTAIPNPATYGQSIVLYGTVTSDLGGTPTGTVSFYNGNILIGTAPVAGGIASLAIDDYPAGFNIPAGVVTFKATYNGDNNFRVTQFPSLAVTINKAPTTVSIISESPNPSLFGQTINLTASVQSVLPTSIPTGTVTFLNGATVLGTATLDLSGIASLNVSNLAVGTATITVKYNGDTNFLTSVSTAISQTISKDDTSTTGVSAGASTFGGTATFNLRVSPATPGAGTPTGTVAVRFGSVNLGTATLSGGTATFNTSSLPAGTNTITLTYSGDTNFNASTGFLTQTVNAAATTTTLNPLTTPSVFGQAVTFSTTVTSSAGTPTGIVTFFDGTTQIGVATLSSGSASITVDNLNVGTHPIRVVYAGGGNFAGSSSSTLNQVVIAANTTTTLSSSLSTTPFGREVTFTANVIPTAPSSGTPSGTVTFYDNGTPLGSVTLGIGGVATFTTTSLTTGSHPNVYAVYGGSTNFNTSTSPSITQIVNPAATVTSVVSFNNPTAIGGPVTLNVAVNAFNQGTGLAVPNGTVQAFYDGTPISGTVSLVGGAATITLTTPPPLAGPYPIVVTYVPATSPQNFTTSSGALDQIIDRTSTTTTVTSSPNPSTYGQTVIFTASVSGAGATGTVNFIENGMVIGTGVLSSGTASFSISTLSVGSHTITATYSGDGNFLGSSGTQSIPQVVNQAASTTTIVLMSPNPSQFGQIVDIVATISTPIGTPTGLVQFYDGLTLLGTVSANDGTAYFSTNTLSIGTHQITAKYLGDINFTGSTSLPQSQVVTQIFQTDTSITTLTSSDPEVDFGCPVTFTIIVTPNQPHPPTPTGVVTLLSGTQTLVTLPLTAIPPPPANAAMATFTTSDLPAGSTTIVAIYSGDANYSSSTATIVQVVDPIPTSLSLTSSENPSIYLDNVTFTATVTAMNSCLSSVNVTGSVSFYDNTQLLGTTNLDGSGHAVFSSSLLTVGTHTINAVYNPDPDFDPSSNSLQQIVTCMPTNTEILTAVPNPSAPGEVVSFFASVSSATGLPTGTVIFYDNGIPLAPNPIPLSNGLAVLNTSTLSVGNHSITVFYSGATNYCLSNSTGRPYIQTVETPPLVQPVHDFYGCQVINKYLNFDDIVNVLTWLPPQNDDTILYYKIFRDSALTDLAGVVENQCPYRFEDGNRKKRVVYTYYIVAVNAQGDYSPVVSTKVIPKHK